MTVLGALRDRPISPLQIALVVVICADCTVFGLFYVPMVQDAIHILMVSRYQMISNGAVDGWPVAAALVWEPCI